MNRITMGPATRASLFIPADACYLAFLHPAKALEKALEATNISDDPWAYLLLIGGFAFFDADRKLQSVNALSLTPTRHEMHFDGPHEMDSEDIARLRVQGRLHEVFMDALQEQGLHECAWVHPNETIGDIATRESEPDAPGTRKQFAYGALVYITESEKGSALEWHSQASGTARPQSNPTTTYSTTSSRSRRRWNVISTR